jgi:hypothetical protein
VSLAALSSREPGELRVSRGEQPSLTGVIPHLLAGYFWSWDKKDKVDGDEVPTRIYAS